MRFAELRSIAVKKLRAVENDREHSAFRACVWKGFQRVYRLFAHGGRCDPRARDSCDECERSPAVVGNVAARGSQRIESTVMDRRYNEAVESVSGPTSVG